MASIYNISSGTGRVEISRGVDSYLAIQLTAASLDANVTYKLQHSSDGVNFFDISGTNGTLVSASDSALVETYDFTLDVCYLYVDVGSATTGDITIIISNKKKDNTTVNNGSLNPVPVSVLSESGERIESSPFNELAVIEKTTVIELKSIYGYSIERDNKTETGSGTVTNAIGDREYNLNISAAGDVARLESIERGRYIAGKSAEYGIGVRTQSATYTGDTEAIWGAINNNDGMYFGKDSTGNFIEILDNATPTRIYQSSWNVDKLDGTGKSGLTLDTTAGNVYNVQFTWYGYGVMDFVIYIKSILGLKKVVVHRYIIDGQTSIANPNLPITAQISQTASTNNESLYVGGRQFSILGNYTPNYRVTSELVLGKSIGTAGLIPIISFRYKSAYKIVNSKIEGIDILSTQPLLLEIYQGATLVGSVFGTPTRTTASETAFESDTTASSYSGGEILYRDLAPGGSGSSKSVGDEDLRDLILDIPTNQNITLVAQSIGASTATADIVFRIREEW